MSSWQAALNSIRSDTCIRLILPGMRQGQRQTTPPCHSNVRMNPGPCHIKCPPTGTARSISICLVLECSPRPSVILVLAAIPPLHQPNPIQTVLRSLASRASSPTTKMTKMQPSPTYSRAATTTTITTITAPQSRA